MNTELVIDFVNTARFDPEREDLPTPAALVAWLAARGLEPGNRSSRADYEDARSVREALRALLLAHNGVVTDEASALGVIDAAAVRSALAVRFAPGGSRLEPGVSGVRGAVGRILAEVAAGMADGSWERLKACRADDCRYAFLDSAKNRSRAWCSMESCGNREKARVHRRRAAGTSPQLMS